MFVLADGAHRLAWCRESTPKWCVALLLDRLDRRPYRGSACAAFCFSPSPWRLTRMDMLTALAVSVAVLLAVWVKVTAVTGTAWFVGAIGWACYSAAGGKTEGLKKAIAAGIAGMIWVGVAYMILLMSGHPELEWLGLGVVAFLIIIEAKVRLLSFIPAALCGAAIIGAGGVVAVFDLASNIKVAVTFAVGAVVGYIAEWAGGMLTKKA